MGVIRWIVTQYDWRDHTTECVIVEAESEEEAAVKGANRLQQEIDEGDSRDGWSYVDHVFVMPWDERTAYAMRPTFIPERAPNQCCGGGPGVLKDGHWGGCRARKGDE